MDICIYAVGACRSAHILWQICVYDRSWQLNWTVKARQPWITNRFLPGLALVSDKRVPTLQHTAFAPCKSYLRNNSNTRFVMSLYIWNGAKRIRLTTILVQLSITVLRYRMTRAPKTKGNETTLRAFRHRQSASYEHSLFCKEWKIIRPHNRANKTMFVIKYLPHGSE